LINYISNLPKDLRSGGFSAMNVAAFSVLSSLETVHYVGPINPPLALWHKALSKSLRLMGSQGDFSFFSDRRLEAIADEVGVQCATSARLDFFHGFTPWALTRTHRPYVAWSDCTFRDYIDIFHRREKYRECDLKRIEQTEAAWLRNARRVLFTSDWAATRAMSCYALNAGRVGNVGIFGEIDLPSRDAYAGEKEFAFVSTNFEAKGGQIVLAAFREVRERHPDARLTVVGDQPSHCIVDPGVHFVGFLRKEVSHEYERFKHILGRARALVHPTKCDIAPLLIVEAGYAGCPVIASRRFAIPELVNDGVTGILLDDTSKVSAVSSAMNWMLDNGNQYGHMREAAWVNTRARHSKERFQDRLLSHLREAIVGEVMPVQ
jgi:glycosyltransferase involved in cell wall biosynthesis